MLRLSFSLAAAATMLAACAGPFSPGTPGLSTGHGYGRDYRAQPLYSRAGAAPGPAAFPNIGYATWSDDEPDYRLYPGDVMDVTVLSAPELNRTVTVQPDGRITMPLIAPLMVADRSAPQVEAALTSAYASQLIRPEVSISIKQTTPIKVFVGGEVDKPGVYDMPGDIDAMQAVIMAGGFRPGAKSSEVAILRRGAGGQAMLRTADLRGGTRGRFIADAVPLRRFDVIYVPKTGLAEVGAFVEQVRNALPFQFSYVINGQYISSR